MADSGGTIHQLKITLRHIHPPVWRRVLVPSGATLAHLHAVIQIAVGWDDSHLHEFRVSSATFRAPTPWSDDVSAEEDAGRVLLGEVAPTVGSRFEYTYDFGDSWDHDILVEKLLPAETGATYLRCIAGRRACPPEDSGGPWGYRYFVEAFLNPSYPEHNDVVDLAGKRFDPEAFDREKVNQQLEAYAGNAKGLGA